VFAEVKGPDFAVFAEAGVITQQGVAAGCLYVEQKSKKKRR
jgi:hypothetical protein